MKHYSVIRSFSFILFLVAARSGVLFGQTSYYPEKSYFSLSAGYLFNHPVLSHNAFAIKRAVSFDHQQTVSWYRFVSKHAGWMVRGEHCTQSARFKYTDSLVYMSEHFNQGWPHDRYTITVGPSYNFMASRKINFLLVLGPQVYATGAPVAEDSIPYKYRNTLFSFYNTRRFGLGVYVGVHLVYKTNKRFYLFLLPSYQRGFLKIREARVGPPQRYSVLSYYGSGAGISGGLLFHFRKREQEPDEPTE